MSEMEKNLDAKIAKTNQELKVLDDQIDLLKQDPNSDPNIMKKFIASVLLALTLSTPALADYTFVVPQKPGAGTSQWAEIIAKELEPFLGEKIKIKFNHRRSTSTS